ncbi:hypothetical protein BGZ73_004151 [Actinomortierella ambigua]|nr:hypothetical protein BGZ73_004151 [Actinomortierella ambigua]
MRTFYDLNSQLSGGPTGTRPRHPQALENDGRGTEWTLSDEEEWLLDEAAAAAMTAGAEHTVPNQQYGDGEADEYDDEGKVPLDYADLSDNEGKVPTEYVDLSTVDRPRGRGRAVSYLPVGHDSSGRITTTAATHNNDSNSNSHSSHSQESVPSRPRTALESLQEFCRRSNVGRPTGVAATTTTTTTMTTPFSREAEENRADMENGTPDRSVLPANWRRTPSPAPSEGSGNLQGSLVASTLTYRHSSDTESQDSFVSFPSPEYFEDSEDHNPSPSSSSP